MHHHPRYVCVKESGRQNEKCEGMNTCRRSDLIRHLRKQHGKSMMVAYNITMKLHALLMSPANINSADVMREVTSSTKIWGNVCGSSKAKQCARFGLSHMSQVGFTSVRRNTMRPSAPLESSGLMSLSEAVRNLLESSQNKRSRGGGGGAHCSSYKGLSGKQFPGRTVCCLPDPFTSGKPVQRFSTELQLVFSAGSQAVQPAPELFGGASCAAC